MMYMVKKQENMIDNLDKKHSLFVMSKNAKELRF